MLQTAKTYRDQTLTYEDFQLEITDLTLAGTRLKGTFFYRMTQEQWEAYQNGEEKLCLPVIRGANGEECTMLEAASWQEGENCIGMEGEYDGITGQDYQITVVTRMSNRFQEIRSCRESQILLEPETGEEASQGEEAAGEEVLRTDKESAAVTKQAGSQETEGKFQEGAKHIARTVECKQGILEIDAFVIYPKDSAYRGTVKGTPFDAEMVKDFFGEARYWQEIPEEEAAEYENGCQMKYREDEVFQDTHIYGSVSELGNRLDFQMSLNSSAEYEKVKERQKIFDTKQVLNRLGVSAHVFTEREERNYVFQLMIGKLGNVKTTFSSPVPFFGGITYEYGDITSVYFTGNYEISEREPIELLSMEEILDRVQEYGAEGSIYPANSGEAISEIELQYYLEEGQDGITFTPVWVFKVPHRYADSFDGGREEAEEYFYIDAVSGVLVEYFGS